MFHIGNKFHSFSNCFTVYFIDRVFTFSSSFSFFHLISRYFLASACLIPCSGVSISNGYTCLSACRLTGHLCRKKDSASVFRVFGWLMIILVCIALGLVYAGFQSRGGEGGFIPLLREEIRVSQTVIHTNLLVRETNLTAERHQDPGNGDPSSADVSLNKVFGDTGFVSARDSDQGQKPLDSLLGAREASLISKSAEGLVNSDSKSAIPPLLENSKDGVNETTTSANGGGFVKKFECSSNFTMSDPDNVWFQTAIVQKSQKYNVTSDDVADDVIILTPISNVRRHLWKYFQNVCSLTYPHRHISIVLGEDSSSDYTLETAERMAAEMRPYFKRVDVLRLKGSSSRTSGHERHDRSWQLTRRRHLAMARNQLMFAALGGGSEKWVLWMDSDVRHIPSDLVERFIWPQKGIVAANCLYRQDSGQTDTFDRNTWRDTETSKRRLERMPDDFLMLEGYDQTERKFLNDLKGEGDLVRLDGVGGCALFVEADLHRKGLVFPAFVFDHHVETEGMAKMAAHLGVEMYGLPSVNVIHW